MSSIRREIKAKRLLLIVTMLLLAIAAVFAQKPRIVSPLTKNKQSVQRFYDEVFNQHNLAAIDSLVSADYIEHQTTKGYARNKKGLKKGLEDFFKAYPDVQVKVNLMIAKDDMVISQITITGTNTGSFNGMPPTNRKIHIDGIDMVKMRDGKGIEHWGYVEEGKMLTQLGLTKELKPSPDTGEASSTGTR